MATGQLYCMQSEAQHALNTCERVYFATLQIYMKALETRLQQDYMSGHCMGTKILSVIVRCRYLRGFRYISVGVVCSVIGLLTTTSYLAAFSVAVRWQGMLRRS